MYTRAIIKNIYYIYNKCTHNYYIFNNDLNLTSYIYICVYIIMYLYIIIMYLYNPCFCRYIFINYIHNTYYIYYVYNAFSRNLVI